MTVGSQARMQVGVASLMTKYGSQLDSMAQSYNTTGKINKNTYGKYSTSTKTLDELLKSSAMKGKSEEFKSQFSNLYKSIFNIKDDESEDSSVASPAAIRTASANAGSAAEGMTRYARSLKSGDELDVDAYRKQAQAFVDNYNAFVDKVGNAENANVLQKGVLMVNTAKVYSSALKRVGIELGSDNKMTLADDLSNVKTREVKSTFGTQALSDKIAYKARQINELTGGNGLFAPGVIVNTPSSSTSSDKVNNSGTLKTLSADVKSTANAIKDYIDSIGVDDKTFSVDDYKSSVKSFIEKYNSYIDEAAKSDKSSVNSKGVALRSTTNSYKYALKRAGIEIGKDGKLSLTDSNSINFSDAKYAFGYGGYIDKVGQKADQISSLANSASSMGYNANSTANYAYSTGAVYSVYA